MKEQRYNDTILDRGPVARTTVDLEESEQAYKDLDRAGREAPLRAPTADTADILRYYRDEERARTQSMLNAWGGEEQRW